MSKFIEKLGSSKIFMSIVMICNIIFNAWLIAVWIMSWPTHSENVSMNFFGYDTSIASYIVLIISNMLFIILDIYVHIKLLARYNNQASIEFKSLIFNNTNNDYANILVVSILFLWNIFYNLVFSILTLKMAMRVEMNYMILLLVALLVLSLIFAILNTIYYTFLIKKLLQKPKEELKEEVNKELNE